MKGPSWKGISVQRGKAFVEKDSREETVKENLRGKGIPGRKPFVILMEFVISPHGSSSVQGKLHHASMNLHPPP